MDKKNIHHIRHHDQNLSQHDYRDLDRIYDQTDTTAKFIYNVLLNSLPDRAVVSIIPFQVGFDASDGLVWNRTIFYGTLLSQDSVQITGINNQINTYKPEHALPVFFSSIEKGANTGLMQFVGYKINLDASLTQLESPSPTVPTPVVVVPPVSTGLTFIRRALIFKIFGTSPDANTDLYQITSTDRKKVVFNTETACVGPATYTFKWITFFGQVSEASSPPIVFESPVNNDPVVTASISQDPVGGHWYVKVGCVTPTPIKVYFNSIINTDFTVSNNIYFDVGTTKPVKLVGIVPLVGTAGIMYNNLPEHPNFS